MRKFLVFLTLVVLLSLVKAQDDEDVVSPAEEGETEDVPPIDEDETLPPQPQTPNNPQKPPKKRDYQKTLKYDPKECTIDPPPTLKELEDYYAWMDNYGRKWNNAKERMCKMVRVIDNMRNIEEHNRRFEAGEETFTRALWDGSDLTFEEKNEKYVMKDIKQFKWRSAPVPTPPFPAAAASVNHTASGLVTPATSQGNCGSCYAFAAIAALEGQVRKCGISNAKLSEQSIVDCATIGVWGCSSGWPYWSYYWMQSTGVMTDAAYPYVGWKQTCNYNSSNIIAYVDGAYNYDWGVNETFMRQAVSAVGPVAVVICLSNELYSYSSGILKVNNCCTQVQHAVTIVGYGNDSVAGNFWIVKNTWGSWWGENGFFRIARGTNMCIIESQLSYPSVRKLDGTKCP